MFHPRDVVAQSRSISGKFPQWHAFCWNRGVSLPQSSNRLVEVFIVDTPSAAGVALGAVRTDAESTHVLCRHGDESTPDFMRRVLRRLERIQRTRRVRSLWYVVGSLAVRTPGVARLLKALVPLLESGACLTVVGPCSAQGTIFEWIDSLMDSTLGDVSVRAQLYADEAEAAVLRSAARHAKAVGTRGSGALLTVAAAAARARLALPGSGDAGTPALR
jgi:hypothetical protein